jgi:hypothetical protein
MDDERTVEQNKPERLSDRSHIAILGVEVADKMMVKSPGVIVPMTGQTSVVEFELVKAD